MYFSKQALTDDDNLNGAALDDRSQNRKMPSEDPSK
jgi:hypothetical protein